MKRLLILIVSFLSISFANAQGFSPFKVDIAIGGAIPGGPGAKGGLLFSVEPKYAVIQRLSVGFRTEVALMARGYQSSDGSNASADIAASASYLATGDYYYTNTLFRPFTGIGAGIYSFANASVGNQAIGTSSGAKFGTMIRAGFEAGHFRMGVEYNIIGKNTATAIDPVSGDKTTFTSKNSYMGVKIGFFIGGGRRKEQSGTIHM